MPRLEGKYKHRKIWRPPGTPFGEAEARVVALRDHPSPQDFAVAALDLVFKAARNFKMEFGEVPGKLAGGLPVVEILFDGEDVICRIMELPD